MDFPGLAGADVNGEEMISGLAGCVVAWPVTIERTSGLAASGSPGGAVGFTASTGVGAGGIAGTGLTRSPTATPSVARVGVTTMGSFWPASASVC